MAIFTTPDARKAFAKSVKVETGGEYEGLPVLSHANDLDKLAECVGEQIGGAAFTKLHLQATKARFAAATSIVIRVSRTAAAISFYEVGGGTGGRDKHLFSPTPRNLQLVLDNADSVKALLASGGKWYYRATPAYTFRGKEQPAKSAAVVALENGVPKQLAKGDAADAMAAELGLQPVNPEGENDSE